MPVADVDAGRANAYEHSSSPISGLLTCCNSKHVRGAVRVLHDRRHGVLHLTDLLTLARCLTARKQISLTALLPVECAIGCSLFRTKYENYIILKYETATRPGSKMSENSQWE